MWERGSHQNVRTRLGDPCTPLRGLVTHLPRLQLLPHSCPVALAATTITRPHVHGAQIDVEQRHDRRLAFRPRQVAERKKQGME